MIRASMARIAARPDLAGLVFCNSLARNAPDLPGFGDADNLPQARAIVAQLARIVSLLDQPERLHTSLVDLAQKARSVGLTPRGYMAIHAALSDMVSGDIARNADAAAEAAWGDAIDLILHTMLRAAHGPRTCAQADIAPLAA
ncbi:globin domain-containing protein [Gymnodinialimonas sp. 2305UL16-5]|uniref:globin domain-containing protein n=1 Tax=Gymnodinialimonas mytili TaxID=3126503 RepID=UPI0030AF4AEC